MIDKDSVGVLSYHYHLTSKVFYPKYRADSKMIALALPDPLSSVIKLEVFSDNIQVINLHKKYKFKETKRKVVSDKEVVCMEFTKDIVR